MFAHETARETVVFTPYIYTYVCTGTLYYIFELVPYVRGKHLKSFRVANILATLFLYKPSEYEHFYVPKKEILT